MTAASNVMAERFVLRLAISTFYPFFTGYSFGFSSECIDVHGSKQHAKGVDLSAKWLMRTVVAGGSGDDPLR
ncbi:hypothetical protein [Saccharomonospora viridis]|uniref:hypothetical protein n=1 Tax=Saccharomonospora viridis TaxID=1852 RepID=UPI00117F8F8B|nr:hypothetical protein [Saccharomonospora viridis]